MAEKEFKTIDEQIEILRSRGLTIENEATAKDFLLHNNFLYSISEQPIKNAVACTFGLTMNKGAYILGSYMHSMTIIRNLCAHGSRIYNRLFEQKPSLSKKEKELLIKDKNGAIDNAHFYGFVLIMKRLLPVRRLVYCFRWQASGAKETGQISILNFWSASAECGSL